MRGPQRFRFAVESPLVKAALFFQCKSFHALFWHKSFVIGNLPPILPPRQGLWIEGRQTPPGPEGSNGMAVLPGAVGVLARGDRLGRDAGG